MRRYVYVGPSEIRERHADHPPGTPIRSAADLAPLAASGEVVLTYVVGLDEVLRVADRRSEHVACAGGEAVLAAGELTATVDGAVIEASNQSTGYCPEPTCWGALRAALERAGIEHCGGFTREFVFRRCPGCGERNLVKDGWFECSLCGAELPEHWNFDEPDPHT
jgi:hypothetical protein